MGQRLNPGSTGDTENSNVFDRTAIVNADTVVAAFLMPISPEHATGLYDVHGAKDVTHTDGGVVIVFGMGASMQYIREFCTKASELVEEKIDREIETGRRTTAEDDARTLSRKMGLA